MCFVQAKLNRKLGGKQLRKIGFLMSCASLASSAIFAANRHDFSPIRIENSHANALWFLGFLNKSRPAAVRHAGMSDSQLLWGGLEPAEVCLFVQIGSGLCFGIEHRVRHPKDRCHHCFGSFIPKIAMVRNDAGVNSHVPGTARPDRFF